MDFQLEVMLQKCSGRAACSGDTLSIMAAAKIGASSMAPSISMPWKKSVQQTAEKPPRKV